MALWTGVANGSLLPERYVFVRDVPAEGGVSFTVVNGDTVFTDGVDVVLPGVLNLTERQRVLIRNIGTGPVDVAAPDAVIDPRASAYTEPPSPVPVWSGEAESIVLEAGVSAELVAMPSKVGRAWFRV